jgi:glycosyltransferase involved in cell wall biosynthesis
MKLNNCISVVVCVKNEESRIEGCLRSIMYNHPSEIIVVDGGSSDRTAELALKYTKKVIISTGSNLTRDRQIGIDSSNQDLIAMIDADHRLDGDSLQGLLNDLTNNDYDIVQSQLLSYKNNNYWNSAEEDAWQLTHNIPGPKVMIGVAPAMYRKSLFSKVKFDDNVTKTIDDTDFIYRLSKIKTMKIGIGETKIKQLHFGSFSDYRKKFKWYGIGDSEFCIKHPHRSFRILYHLIIRYPIIYPLKALVSGKIKVIPFFMMQGFFRFYGLVGGLISAKIKGK